MDLDDSRIWLLGFLAVWAGLFYLLGYETSKETIIKTVIEERIVEKIRYVTATTSNELELFKAQLEEDYNEELKSCYASINDCNIQTGKCIDNLEKAAIKISSQEEQIEALSLDLLKCIK